MVKLGARLPTLLDGWRPDVVHGHDWRMGWAADSLSSIFDVPFILTMHGSAACIFLIKLALETAGSTVPKKCQVGSNNE